MTPAGLKGFRRGAWTLLLGLVTGAAGWVYAGRFSPLVGDDSVDFLFFSLGLPELLVWWMGATAAIALVHAACARRVPGLDRSWLAPLWLLAFPLVPVAVLPTPMYHYAAPWAYVFLDARWLFVALVAGLVAYRLVPRLAPDWWARRRAAIARLDTAPSARAMVALEGLVAATLIAFSLLSSPGHRFTSAVVGDEPKYLRYLENWYQGRGMDITDLPPVRNLPPDDLPNLRGNLDRLGWALSRLPADLRADAAWWLGRGGPGPRAPASVEGGWFVDGKHGGVYQVHTAGSSLLLFPGYVIDRLFLNWNESPEQFAGALPFTNMMLLGLYAAWGVALFRLLHDFSGRAVLSAGLAAVAMLSLPATTFAYQYYPEVAGGLLITVLARFSLLSADARPARLAWAGMLAGFLPWIHVRFLLTAVVIVALITVTRRRDWRGLPWLAAGFAVPLGALGFYFYHVSGNPMPWALYDLTHDTPAFTLSRLLHLPVYWVDRNWGILAHAPVYLLAAAGARPSWRHNRLATAGIALVALALATPAAGHELTGAGTTPLRLIAAVVPLLMLPVAGLLRSGTRAWVRAVFGLLTVLSLHNGWMFNLDFQRFAPWLLGPTVSGWLTRLLLPILDMTQVWRDPWSLAYFALTLALLVLPGVRRRRGGPVAPAAGGRLADPVTLAAATLLGFALLGSAVAAATGNTFNPRFLIQPHDGRERLVAFHTTHDRGGVRWSFVHRGQIDVARVLGNPPGSTVAVTDVQARPGEPATFAFSARTPAGQPAWGRISIDYGDGTPPDRRSLVGDTEVRHIYHQAGEYVVQVAGELPGAGPFSARARVFVGRAAEDDVLASCNASGAEGIPAQLMARPARLDIEALEIDESRVRAHLAPTARPGGGELRVWAISRSGAHAFRFDDSPEAALDLEFAAHLPESRVVCFLVAARRGADWSDAERSRVLRFEWPPAPLVAGAGVRLTPAEAARWTASYSGEVDR